MLARFVSVALVSIADYAIADISYVQRIDVEAAGGWSVFDSSAETQAQISGDKARFEREVDLGPELARTAVDSNYSSSIVRIDKGLVWQLFPDRQQYAERSFPETKIQLEEKASAMRSRGAAAKGAARLPISAEACQWSQGTFETEREPDSEKIAGIESTKRTVRKRQTCTVRETGQVCDVTWIMETWIARGAPGESEAREFRRAYSESWGGSAVGREFFGPSHALLSMFAQNWDEVVEELDDMKGIPLRTVMQMGMGGADCTTESGQPLALDGMWSDASLSAYNAVLGQAGSVAGQAIGAAAGEALGDSVVGSIGGAAVGSATSSIIGGLTGSFRKQKKPVQKSAQADPANSQVTVFRISSEVSSWKEGAIPVERFEQPADWDRI